MPTLVNREVPGLMVGEGDHVLIFPTIHAVMHAERILKEHSLAVRLIPAPRPITSDCGLAIVFPPEQAPGVRRVLSEAGNSPRGWYRHLDGTYVTVSLEEVPM